MLNLASVARIPLSFSAELLFRWVTHSMYWCLNLFLPGAGLSISSGTLHRSEEKMNGRPYCYPQLPGQRTHKKWSQTILTTGQETKKINVKFHLDKRKHLFCLYVCFLTMKVVKHWKVLPGEVLKIFKTQLATVCGLVRDWTG